MQVYFTGNVGRKFRDGVHLIETVRLIQVYKYEVVIELNKTLLKLRLPTPCTSCFLYDVIRSL